MSDWFDEKPAYTGVGRARFENPTATLVGPASATLDDLGDLTITFEVERVESDDPVPFGTLGVLQGTRMVGSGGRSLGFGLESTPCLSFKLETEAGVLEVNDPSIRSWTLNTATTNTPIVFSPDLAVFRASGAIEPKYWVVPITNLSRPFWTRHRPPDEVLDHPLRIYRRPSPEEVPPDREWIVIHNLSRVLSFSVRRAAAFIEPLRDFTPRQNRLRERKDMSLLTSVMVGRCSQVPESPIEGLTDIPLHLLWILGLASESVPGAPWIEFRDGTGRLSARVHQQFWTHDYQRGTVFIEGWLHHGLSDLLTACAEASSEAREGAIREALRLLLSTTKLRINFEDNLSNLFRSLESLWIYIVEVKGDEKLRILTPVKKSGGSGFGQKIVGLLTYLDLQDAEVCEAKFGQAPRSFSVGTNEGTWAGFLSQARGMVMHRGFGTSGATGSDYHLGIALHRHMIDLVARVILKLLSYQGTYQPRVVAHTDPRIVDWVTKDTEVEDLGYLNIWP